MVYVNRIRSVEAYPNHKNQQAYILKLKNYPEKSDGYYWSPNISFTPMYGPFIARPHARDAASKKLQSTNQLKGN